MKITILTSSKEHPVNIWLHRWINEHATNHQIELIHNKKEIVGGDLLFLISCSEFISRKFRDKFKKTLVLHASDLPQGRGWSPHIWEILKGSENITLSLLEAEDMIDSGYIWKKTQVHIPKTALFDEINQIIFEAELNLMSFAVENFQTIQPVAQNEEGASYWPKRTPQDSEVDINLSLNDQFDLIRVCDPQRYPAFFYKDGKKFKLIIENADE